MKRILISILTAASLALALCGCAPTDAGSIEAPAEAAAEPSAKAPAEAPAGLEVSVDELRYTIREEAGEVGIISSIYPVLSCTGGAASDVLDAINEAVYRGEQAWLESIRSQYEEGVFDGEFTGQTPYEFVHKWSLTYHDARIVSMRLDGYDFSGGAHPLPYTGGLTFSLETGEALTLHEVYGAPDAASVEALAAEGFMAMVNAEPDAYFEDAAQTLAGFSNISYTWCVTDGGIEFSLPDYCVAPHASGITAYTLPLPKQMD